MKTQKEFNFIWINEHEEKEKQFLLGVFFENIEKNLEKAAELYQMAAQNGHLHAMNKYAKLLLHGKGVKKNIKRAVEMAEKPAQAGYAEAQYIVGLGYETAQIEDKPNYQAAVKWFQLAASQEYDSAQFSLGYCYAHGLGVEKNLHKAVELFRIAANKGHLDAKCHYAAHLYNGEGVAQNIAQSIALWRKAADKGHAESQCKLGDHYQFGNSEDKNRKEAFKWYQLAANQQFAEGQFKLSQCYAQGVGTEQDFKKAVKYCKMAAQNNYLAAMYDYAMYLYNGKYSVKDIKQSLSLAEKAADRGYAEAQCFLGRYYQLEAAETERDYKKAVNFYQLAAKQNDGEGQYRLAQCYMLGHGVPKDLTHAFEMLELSAQNNHILGIYHLASCYKYGNGTPQNHAKAFTWYIAGACLDCPESLCAIGDYYFKGLENSIEQSFIVARSYYEKALKLTKTPEKIQWRLGRCYEQQGNFEKAMELYLLSSTAEDQDGIELINNFCDKNPDLAMFYFGQCYQYGKAGVRQDHQEAFQLYQKRPSAESLCAIGDYYFNGQENVVEQNFTIAKEYYEKALILSSKPKEIQWRLGRCFEQDNNLDEAIDLYRKSTAAGDSNGAKWLEKSLEKEPDSISYYLLGVYYQRNQDDRDINKAIHYLQLAVKLGDTEARERLARINSFELKTSTSKPPLDSKIEITDTFLPRFPKKHTKTFECINTAYNAAKKSLENLQKLTDSMINNSELSEESLMNIIRNSESSVKSIATNINSGKMHISILEKMEHDQLKKNEFIKNFELIETELVKLKKIITVKKEKVHEEKFTKNPAEIHDQMQLITEQSADTLPATPASKPPVKKNRKVKNVKKSKKQKNKCRQTSTQTPISNLNSLLQKQCQISEEINESAHLEQKTLAIDVIESPVYQEMKIFPKPQSDIELMEVEDLKNNSTTFENKETIPESVIPVLPEASPVTAVSCEFIPSKVDSKEENRDTSMQDIDTNRSSSPKTETVEVKLLEKSPSICRLPKIFLLSDLKDKLTEERYQALIEVGKLLEEFKKIGVKSYIQGTFAAHCASRLVNKNFEAKDIDLVVELPKNLNLKQLFEKIPLETRQFCFKFTCEGLGFYNYDSVDKKTTKVGISIKDHNYIRNYNPFPLTNHKIFCISEPGEEIKFCFDDTGVDESFSNQFYLNELKHYTANSKLSLFEKFEQHILNSEFPVHLPNPNIISTIWHFLPRFAKYFIRCHSEIDEHKGDNSLKMVYYDPITQKQYSELSQLTDYLEKYFIHRLNNGDIYRDCMGIEKMIQTGTFTNSLSKIIIEPLCTAYLKHFLPKKREESLEKLIAPAAKDMTAKLQNHFLTGKIGFNSFSKIAISLAYSSSIEIYTASLPQKLKTRDNKGQETVIDRFPFLGHASQLTRYPSRTINLTFNKVTR